MVPGSLRSRDESDGVLESCLMLRQVTNSYFIGSWDDRRMLEIAGPGTYAEFQLQRLGLFFALVQRLPPCLDCLEE